MLGHSQVPLKQAHNFKGLAGDIGPREIIKHLRGKTTLNMAFELDSLTPT